MGYAGQVAPNFGIDNMVLFMRGPDDGQLRIAFREDTKIKLDEFREKLRKALPDKVGKWLVGRLVKGGLSRSEAEVEAKKATFGFGPGDIVTNVMSFGSSTPIAVRIVGTDLKMVRQHGEKIAAEMKRISYLRDIGFEQQLDYPTLEVEIDREKAGLSGATVDDVRRAIVMGACSTRFANLNYWVDIKTGFDYLVQVQMPPLEAGPALQSAGRHRDFAAGVGQSPGQPDGPRRSRGDKVRKGVRPGEIDRDMSQRYLTLTANVEGEDMGRAAKPGRQGDRVPPEIRLPACASRRWASCRP